MDEEQEGVQKQEVAKKDEAGDENADDGVFLPSRPPQEKVVTGSTTNEHGDSGHVETSLHTSSNDKSVVASTSTDNIPSQNNSDNDDDGKDDNNNNTNHCYCEYAARNIDEVTGSILTVDNRNSPFCKIPPPGADAFAAWFADGSFHDLQQSREDDDDNTDDESDDDDNLDSNCEADKRCPCDEDTHEAHKRCPCHEEDDDMDIAALEEQRFRHDPVRRFMGPLDHSLARQIRRRRRNKFEYDQGFSHNTKGVPFDSVSFKKLDTPVWHNYTMEIQRQRQGQGHLHRHHAKGGVGTTTPHFSRLSPPDMVRTRKQLRQRPVIGWLRRIFSCPRSRTKTGPDHPISTYQQDEQLLIRIVLICIGIIVSMVSKIVEEASEWLLVWKLDYIGSFVDDNTNSTNYTSLSIEATTTNMTDDATLHQGQQQTHFAAGFGIFMGFNLLFTILAFLPVLFRPVAAGSGIAEAKAVLNGIILPKSTDILTALCKAASVIFTASASLPVGLEGPLIFMGMAMGENAQRFLPTAYAGLKTDRLKRDFAVVGTSCGVTGAFLSPIGGVLFAMEEGASFWNTRLAWRSFAAACVTAITMYMWGLAFDQNFHLDVNSMAIYSGLNGENIALFPTFSLWHYFVFAVMGLLGGVLGAVWIEANYYLAVLRNKVPSRMRRTYKVAELVVLSILVSLLLWYLPLAYTVCSDVADTSASDKTLFRQMNCPPGQYNHLATLFMNPVGSVGLNLLYWEPDYVFHPTCCLIAGVVYFVLLLLLFGTSISMGIFIPLLYTGACFGRATGVWLNMGSQFTRTFAIVFSVAMLAGVVRVLISISAIIMCATALTYMVTPFMVATIFARVTGKAVFGKEGIYDVILELKGIPFLESEAPKAIRLRGLRAQDVMSRSPLITLEPEPSVGRVMEVLEKYPFPDYPVVDPTRGGIFMGVVTRQDLLTVMKHPALFVPRNDLEVMDDNDDDDDNTCRSRSSRLLALRFEELVHQRYRNVPTLEAAQKVVTNADRKYCVVDLTPYLEIGHYTLNRLVSIERTFELFRTLGLRDLIITDHVGRPVGVITRYDLKLLEEVGVDELKLSRMRSNVGTHAVS